MKAVAVAALLLAAQAAAPAAAQPIPTDAEAGLMRDAWKTSKQDSIGINQRVFTRVVAFKVPRPFVIAYRQQVPGGYIAEYVPDGETIENWTRMVTLSAQVGMGAAKLDDAAVADVMFNRGGCPGWLYRDLGPGTSPTSAKRRNLVIGCDSVRSGDYAQAVADAGERNAIALLRDDETVWTVQYAERNLAGNGKALFDTATAPALLDRMAIVACSSQDKAGECSEVLALGAAIATGTRK